jgi:acyl dehydratase
MNTLLYFEDYTVGEARSSIGRTITETDIVLHAGQTGDFYPHHMDAEWCKSQDFKQRIAHGTLIFSVAVGQTAGAINPAAFSYGYDRLRFIKPVFIGDTIYTIRENLSKQVDSETMGKLRVSYSVYKGEGELALYAEHLLTALYRDPAAFAEEAKQRQAEKRARKQQAAAERADDNG